MHAEFLKSITLFKDLSDTHIHELSAKVKTTTYKKGEFIFHETDEAVAVFFVKSGIVKIKKINQHGKELVICMKRTGDIFAETSLFCEPATPYPGIAQTLSNAEVLYLSRTDLEDLMAVNPSLSIEIVKFMGKQLRSMTELLRDIALLDIYGKTVHIIQKLAYEFGSETTNGLMIEIPLSIQELANIVGTTRESVSRVLSKLKEQNLVKIEGKNIIIINWCKFCDIITETTHK